MSGVLGPQRVPDRNHLTTRTELTRLIPALGDTDPKENS